MKTMRFDQTFTILLSMVTTVVAIGAGVILVFQNIERQERQSELNSFIRAEAELMDQVSLVSRRLYNCTCSEESRDNECTQEKNDLISSIEVFSSKRTSVALNSYSLIGSNSYIDQRQEISITLDTLLSNAFEAAKRNDFSNCRPFQLSIQNFERDSVGITTRYVFQ